MRIRLVGTWLTAGLLLVTACGTQMSREEIAAASGAGGESAADFGGRDAGPAVGEELEGGSGAPGAPASNSLPSGSGGSGIDVPDESPTPSSGPDSPLRPTPGSPITIGTVTTLSGPIGNNIRHGVLGVQAWVNHINARGGVNGHPVEYIVEDDGFDPARHVALLQELVERHGVQAFVMNNDGLQCVGADYLQARGIPVIGATSGDGCVYEHPLWFPQGSHGASLAFAVAAATADVARPDGRLRLGTMACAEAAACGQWDQVWNSDEIRQLGFEPVYRSRPLLTQPDFTAECLSAQQAGAQTLLVVMDANSLGRISASCARQDFRPLFGFNGVTVQDNILSNDELEGSVMAQYTFAWPASNTPAYQEFHDALTEYAPDAAPNGLSSGGWTAAKLFERAARALPEPPTSGAILEGLWSIQNDDLGGLSYPLTFTRDAPAAPMVCWSTVRIEGGEFAALNGGAVSCI